LRDGETGHPLSVPKKAGNSSENPAPPTPDMHLEKQNPRQARV
jgi:hypothetical protein